MRLRRYVILLLTVAVLVGGFFVGQAQATGAHVFTITGGSPGQQQIVRDTLEDARWDWTWGSDVYPATQVTLTPSHRPFWGDPAPIEAQGRPDELAFTFEAFGAIWGVAYYPSGDIYIDSRVTDSRLLRETVMHEAAHSRVMFRWYKDAPLAYQSPALAAWKELVGPIPTITTWETNPVECHAEWFRVTYLDPALQYHAYPRSALPGPPGGTADVIAFHEEWCELLPPEPEPPAEPEPPEEPQEPIVVWPDIPGDDTELLAASIWAIEQGGWRGYEDGTFGPWRVVLRRHVVLVAQRCGLEAPAWQDDYTPATRGEVRDNLPGLVWLEERWGENLSRSQLLRLMYRTADPDAAVAARLEAWFAQTTVTWQGATRSPRLTGYADLMVRLSREHNVPLWLALGQCWRESQWGTTGLSVTYNCLWGVKDTAGKWGELRGLISGFADYTTVEECIRAYFRLLGQGTYRQLIDAQDWRGLLDYYAPASENDTEQHYRIVMAIRDRCEERGVW